MTESHADKGLTADYSPKEERPLKGYVAAMGTYGLLVGGLTAIARLRGAKLPKRIEPYDLVLAAVATHKLARIITKDAITSPIRAPFTKYKEPAGAGELNEDVTATGGTHALGELITCPFCVAVWIATAAVGGLVIAPRFARLATSTFSLVAASDALQFGYDAVKKTDQ